jgi:hypothetical protein
MTTLIGAALQCQYEIIVMWVVGAILAGIELYLLVLVLIPVAGIIRARDTIATHDALDKFFRIRQSTLRRDGRKVRIVVDEYQTQQQQYKTLLTMRQFRTLFIVGVVLWSFLIFFSGSSFCGTS